jgi:acetyltransferase-like isoleucine patch superfamily enzyme
MNIIKVGKRIKSDIGKFFFKNLNNSYRVRVWKKMGVKMGKDCRISCLSFSPESYLIELGDNVVISHNTKLITHEGGISIFHHENPKLDLFGKIKIGNNCFIGMNCLILPNTEIGNNCVIGAGSVIRGNIPDNSVVYGNPGKVVMKTNVYKLLIRNNPGTYEYKGLSDEEKKKILLQRLGMNDSH